MPNVAENLNEAAETLAASLVAEPRREAASLLALALGKDRTFLVAHPEYELTEMETARFREFLGRRAGREPFQQIAGKQEFFGLDFIVSEDVLIPRPETEMLVEAALEILEDQAAPAFCEIGVGSGCISVSILHDLENACGLGLDISEKALRVAAVNAARHDVAERLTLEISDVFAVLKNASLAARTPSPPFDLVVSNPPYIAAGDVSGLQPEVRDFEPLAALTDGADGLSIIRRIILEAPGFLKPEGWLLLEIGFGQAEAVREMFAAGVWRAPEILLDLQSIPRTVRAQTKAAAGDG